MKRAPLIVSFILFLALCASAAYWVLQFIQPKARPMIAPPESTTITPPLSAAATLLGGKANKSPSSDYQLSGIIMANNPAERVAIIASQGQAAHAYRIHAQLSSGTELAEINKDHVLLAMHGEIKRINLIAAAQLRVNNTLPPSPASQGRPSDLPGTTWAQAVGVNNPAPIVTPPAPLSP